jgi:hypothetical protein
MKISNIQISIEGENISLTADCSLRHFGLDRVYFKFDKKYKDFIVTDASPFAAALLVPSMQLGQDLIIEGTISEQLYKGLHEIMKIMLSWNIGLKPISIKAGQLKKDDYPSTKSASFFSGGVDSFYTYLKNKKSGAEKIQYFILANGYDIALGNDALWDLTCKTVENVAQEEGIEVIKVESNVRGLIEPIVPWDYTHGGCLAALGLALRKELKNIFIASSYAYGQLIPRGSHPDTDPLWSTETLSFHHDGADVYRVEKVEFIAHDPVVLKNLRVCYLNKKYAFNCGVCDKCLRTMISLQIAGTLAQSETFPRTIDLDRVRSLVMEGEHGAIFHRENLDELEKLNMDPALQAAIKEALTHIDTTEPYDTGIIKRIWLFDYLYNRGRIYKAILYMRKNL